MAELDRLEYPELNLIAWDLACQKIAAETAFSLYERRWSYVDKARLTKHEIYMIKKLTDKFGSGIFMPA